MAVWMTEAPPEVTPNVRPRKRLVVIAIDDGRLNTNGAPWGVLKARRTVVGPDDLAAAVLGARQDRSELQVRSTSRSERAFSRPARQ